MHRQGTRNSYGSEMRWPPGTRTCGYGSGTSWPGAWGPPGERAPPQPPSYYLPVEGPGQLLALQGQLVAQPHHQSRALGHSHLNGVRLGDPGVGESGPWGGHR